MSGRKMKKVLMLASVASMIDQFNMPNIRLMQKMGYEVHVACNFIEGNTCNVQRIHALRKTFDDMQVRWHQWDCPRDLSSAAKCCRAYWQLWQLTGRRHFVWMHCHSPIGGALARIVAWQRGIRVIYTAHGFHFYKGAPWKNWLLYYPVEKILAYRTDELITINKEDYSFAKRHLKAKKICHIPGVGIDVDKFAALQLQGAKEFRRKYQIPEHALLLLSVGELNAGKNHRMVIAALAALPRQDVYYCICGQGALRGELEQYAASQGVGGRIRMLGYQEDMPQIYQSADIFVFPSVREGMPVALMEAMASGLPCVVSDIRGNRELVDDAAGGRAESGRRLTCQKPGGMRFSLEQPQQLKMALERLLEDVQLRKACGAFNRKKVRSYSQEAVQKRMCRIYKDI